MEMFDTLIYGASWYGVVTALKAARAGKKVALFNHYGFPGGVLSTCLSVYQRVDDTLLYPETISAEVYEEIRKERGGILKNEGLYLLFNPEIIKIKLLKALEDSSVYLLFYVVPVAIEIKNACKKVTFYQRDGLKEYGCTTLIDASENASLERLIHPVIPLNHSIFHCFIQSPQKPIYDSLVECIELDNHRWWVSVNFEADKKGNEDPSLSMHRTLDRLYDAMLDQGATIQLVPIQPESLYHFSENTSQHFSPFLLSDADNFKKIIMKTLEGELHDS
ncbi:MAG: FAD-dependent oxidoreductase [Candidatus Marinimicrobia bacterium]|nr:FAD-dependent oxidoreductase [Candidatus Neomarinimicrobiota bacterium]MDD5582318.1 FAD-dependent oxidoreductase [Candidatus Neomarinimicrobiota bacterium]